MTPTDPDAVEVSDLARRLRAAAAAYYDGTEQLMSDVEYDASIEVLREAASTDPELESAVADLLTAVAAGQSIGGDVAHPALMGSLDKARDLDEVAALMAAVGGPVVVEPKLDGLAVRAEYKHGELHLVATRGDGVKGEDITKKAFLLKIVGLPLVTPESLPDFEVRGEVFMANADFPRAQAIRAESGGAPFVNQRNGAAGVLRKGDSRFAGILRFAAYDVAVTSVDYGAGGGSHVKRLEFASNAGVDVERVPDEGWVATPTSNVEDAFRRIHHLGEIRERLPFPIDGAVIKADLDEDRSRLGSGTKAPKWAIAFKYPSPRGRTRVRGIETSVGRTGRLSIRVEVDPISVGGTTISYASGHNVSWMESRDVRVGDIVMVKRAGDVIPYIDEVVIDPNAERAARWVPPAMDPNGNAWDKTTLLWRSLDPSLSLGGLIEYAVSRNALDIEGLGPEIVAALVERGHVESVADLFLMNENLLATLSTSEGRMVGRKAARKIMREVEEAKSAPWSRIITALGMRTTGPTTSRRLAAAFPTMKRLRNATVSDFADVDGIGPVKAEVIYRELHGLACAGVLRDLRCAGVNMGSDRDGDEGDLPLTGLTIVVSGSVPGYTRTTVAEMIEAKGGRSSSSISAATSVLVSEPSTSAKYIKAAKLGVRILTPQEFLELAGG